MRILVAGLYEWVVPITHNCANALESLGCEVERFDSDDPVSPIMIILMRIAKSFAKIIGMKQNLSAYFNQIKYKKRLRRFLDSVDRFNPDVILVIRLNHYDVVTMKRMQEKGINTICWMIEPKSIDVVMKDMPGYDHYYSMHRSHQSVGAKYLPVFAYDPDNFFPSDKIIKKIPLLFVGHWSARRQEWLESLVCLSSSISIIGYHWRKKLGGGHPLYGSVKEDGVDLRSLRYWYQSAQIVININRLDTSNAGGGNLRLADVPACKTVLLSEYSDDLREHFDLDIDIAVFYNKKELLDKCRKLLANQNLRNDIEQAGFTKVHSIGTYQDRMMKILRDVGYCQSQA
ncbi:MAG: glycosyltransferase family 1 protein [Candidatus Brocadiales bacterium]|nr:glycosyltransferase family 1 protein [Candidatus Brocadiales bacterium]